MKPTRQKFSTDYIHTAKLKDASLKYSFFRDMHDQTITLVEKFDYEVRMITAAFLSNPETDIVDSAEFPEDNEVMPQNASPESTQKGLENSDESNCEDLHNEISKNTPSWLKGLFKKIAIKCHPDKLTSQNLSSREMHFMLANYELARSALMEVNEASMVCVGIDLDIVGELGVNGSCELLNSQSKHFDNKVTSLKSTPIWMWGDAGDDLQKKAQILCNVLGQLHGKPVNLDRALSAIKTFYALPPERRRPGQHPGPGLRKERM